MRMKLTYLTHVDMQLVCAVVYSTINSTATKCVYIE